MNTMPNDYVLKECEHNFVLDYTYEIKRQQRGSSFLAKDVHGIYVCSKCLKKKEILLKQG